MHNALLCIISVGTVGGERSLRSLRAPHGALENPLAQSLRGGGVLGFFLGASSLAANERADREHRVGVLSELVQGEDVSLLLCVVGQCPGPDPASPALWMQSPKQAAAACSSVGAPRGEGRGDRAGTLGDAEDPPFAGALLLLGII